MSIAVTMWKHFEHISQLTSHDCNHSSKIRIHYFDFSRFAFARNMTSNPAWPLLTSGQRNREMDWHRTSHTVGPCVQTGSSESGIFLLDSSETIKHQLFLTLKDNELILRCPLKIQNQPLVGLSEIPTRMYHWAPFIKLLKLLDFFKLWVWWYCHRVNLQLEYKSHEIAKGQPLAELRLVSYRSYGCINWAN